MSKHTQILGRLGTGRRGSSILEMKYLIEEEMKNARVFRILAMEKGLIYASRSPLCPSKEQINQACKKYLTTRLEKSSICAN